MTNSIKGNTPIPDNTLPTSQEPEQTPMPPMNIHVTYNAEAVIKTPDGTLITISSPLESEQLDRINTLSTIILSGITAVACSIIYLKDFPYKYHFNTIYSHFKIANNYIAPASGAFFALGSQQLFSVVSDYCTGNKMSVWCKVSTLIKSGCFFTLAALSYTQVNKMCYYS